MLRVMAMITASEFTLSSDAWNAVARHARETFPDECCGVILANGAHETVQPLDNIQNKLHALDPETYPRTAVIAYAMDLNELERVIDNGARNGANLKAFYHSHPDHEAYFSAEDKAFASPFGEPTFPNATQIVVSIYGREVKRMCAFAWSQAQSDFVEVPIKKI
ncbi:MAG: hypothetical protein EXR70_23520 [Deltaproteobacteria bacterium]|nr:hypothetical protein [Deltaproteobacteria bacterium]